MYGCCSSTNKPVNLSKKNNIKYIKHKYLFIHSSVVFVRQDENENDVVRPLFSMTKMRLRRTSPKPYKD